MCTGEETKGSFEMSTWEQAGHSGSRPSLLPKQMTLNNAFWARLLMCWVFVIFFFFKDLIKENAIMMFLT